MLQIKNVCKEYRTGSLVQKALDGVSLNLRDNEFVAILGPSGSGKTTLLNIIGGLDRYDSGDLIINGISTKQYKDRDWDSYRNHTIGFVFQSYNLITHQTILANVELALTISGVGKGERRERAARALEKVGLGDQLHKKPGQLSGGQMQRVAIARALVNDPYIVLADEPTGALDSETSVQVMDLLREVAKDRLVVMVTHNPELAQEYATRIVRLKDGKIRSDSNEFVLKEEELAEPEHRNMGKSSMSFLTALSLSFNNLRTKKARTLLTSFAGSIGIIGIALILALSTGVNRYIQQVEEETLSEYPLQIQSTGLDLSSMMGGEAAGQTSQKQAGEVGIMNIITDMFSTMDSNDLESLKVYLDSGESGIENYTNAIEYTYSVEPRIYRQEDDGSVRQVHPDQSFQSLGLGSGNASNSMMSSMMSTDVFFAMPENENLYKGQYDVKAGRWPENDNECVLVLTSGGSVSDFMLYTMGLRDSLELDEMIRQFANEETVEVPENSDSYSYEDFLGITFKLVNAADCYTYDSHYHVWQDKTGDETFMENLVADSEDLTIVGVVQPAEGANGMALSSGICYPPSLIRHVAEEAKNSEIVRQQIAQPGINVFTGEAFGEESQEEFDMSSLFTIDAEALQSAFGFDESALTQGLSGAFDFSGLTGNTASSGGTADLAGLLNLEDIQMELPEMSGISMEDLLGEIRIQVSEDSLRQTAQGLLEGYQNYAVSHPEADFSSLGENFQAFLQSSEGQRILIENIREIIEANGDITVSTDQFQQMFQELFTGFQGWAAGKGYTDGSRFGEYFMEYLQSGAANDILNKWAGEIFELSGDITITQEQIQKLAGELASGYLSYAQENGYPDPSKMGEYFLDYLGTEEAQALLSQGIGSMVDTGNLEQQIGTAIQNYMGQVAGSFTEGMAQNLESQITSAIQQMMNKISGQMQTAMTRAVSRLGSNIQNALQINPDAFLNAFESSMDAQELSELLMAMNSTGSATYEGNLQSLGYVDFDVPSSISIYPTDFESKEQVVAILDDYNSRMEAEGKKEQVITYTDIVGALMSSVTDIIDLISYVLIAFVAISLVVSSIMIGVITYISVLERRKEIGILRAIGASKGNISQVFNAETFIIGLCAGLIGIGLSLLLLIPGNALIHYLAGNNDVNAVLPALPAVILILLSVGLTLLGGLIPSRKAAKSDPVTALRVE